MIILDMNKRCLNETICLKNNVTINTLIEGGLRGKNNKEGPNLIKRIK